MKIMKQKRGMPVDDGTTFWYVDAVEEAMCFGWIDGTTKKFDDCITRQRFVPRRKGLPTVLHPHTQN